MRKRGGNSKQALCSWAPTVFVAGAIALATPCHALTEYQLGALASATYTNNLNNAANDGSDGSNTAADPSAGLLLQATPSIGLTLQQARSEWSLRYDHSFAYAALGAVSPGGTDALTAAGSYELTGVDTLAVRINGTNSSLTNLLFSSGGANAVNGVQNPGTQRLLRLMVTEDWRHAWSPNWATNQTTNWSGQYNWDDDQSEGFAPSNSILTNSLGLSTTQGLDTFSLVGQLSSQESPQTEDRRWTHLGILSLTWLRPLTVNTTVNASLGAAQLITGAEPPRAAGGLGVAHEFPIGQVNVSASRTQGPDLQTGRFFETDSAQASFNTSLLRRLELNSSVSASVSRRRSFAGNASIDIVSGSAALGWTDGTWSASMVYTVLRQISAPVDEDVQGVFAAPDLTRGALTLIVGATYP